MYYRSTYKHWKVYIASYILKKYTQLLQRLQKLHKHTKQYKVRINYLFTALSPLQNKNIQPIFQYYKCQTCSKKCSDRLIYLASFSNVPPTPVFPTRSDLCKSISTNILHHWRKVLCKFVWEITFRFRLSLPPWVISIVWIFSPNRDVTSLTLNAITAKTCTRHMQHRTSSISTHLKNVSLIF